MKRTSDSYSHTPFHPAALDETKKAKRKEIEVKKIEKYILFFYFIHFIHPPSHIGHFTPFFALLLGGLSDLDESDETFGAMTGCTARNIKRPERATLTRNDADPINVPR